MTTNTNGESLMVQGRILWGVGSSIFEGKAKTDFNTGAPLLDNLGNPIMEYGFGLAVQKGTENFNALWGAMHQQAYTLYPDGNIAPAFAMKYKDGDGVHAKTGKPYSDKEGYAGHIVLACTTRIPPKFFIHDGQQNVMVNTGIKVGDYVNVQLNIKAHPAKGNGNPGLYVNPNAVQLIQAGKAIVNAPSGDEIFGAAPTAYAGQVVADTAPAMPQMPAQGQAPAQPAQPTQAPQAPAQPAQPAQAPAHYGVLPQNMQQAPAQAPMGNAPAAPAMPPTGQMAPQPQNGYAAPAPSSNGMPTPPMPGQ